MNATEMQNIKPGDKLVAARPGHRSKVIVCVESVDFSTGRFTGYTPDDIRIGGHLRNARPLKGDAVKA
jgi:hypothetical protein